nr:S41 family peptidase [Rhodanobacter sp. 7MK24]
MLNALQDHHSRLLPIGEQTDQFEHGRAQGNLDVQILPGDIGYINMPGFTGTNKADGNAFASTVADGIISIAPKVKHGWIVDLRHDTGGNMYPMLSGLHLLLGTGKLGAFRARSGEETPWASALPEGAQASQPLRINDPVAVLIGSNTSSSGEIVAIAFKGRSNTRFFGQPSDGRTTGNCNFQLPDGSGLSLACSVDLDRNGHSYGDRVMPDVDITISKREPDAAMAAAKSWLENK